MSQHLRREQRNNPQDLKATQGCNIQSALILQKSLTLHKGQDSNVEQNDNLYFMTEIN